MSQAEPASPPVTIVEVSYPAHRGRIGLRGSHAPLSWEHTQAPDQVEGDRSIFRVPVPPGETLELKLVRDDGEWANGRNFVLHAGDHMHLEPCFDNARSTLEGPFEIQDGDLTLTYEVLLPPSYGEQESRRYPVVYAVDGQSLWSTSNDPFGIWHLDTELDLLYELDAIEEVIVVGIHTAIDRTTHLSPVPDPQHGGGGAGRLLGIIVDRLKPHVDAAYRTKPGRTHTAMLGSSMGGLFSFLAGWERSDVFGKVACLSSSFWWASRHAVKLVQQGPCPKPRPLIYIDSGAPIHPAETDPNLRDGFHHTRSMFRALSDHGFVSGRDLHWLVYTSASHDAASWRSRIAIPLQLLFPARVRRPAEDALEEHAAA
jgi:predicted alpha/beta superfamily hydrolase